MPRGGTAPGHRIRTLRFDIEGPDEAVLLKLRTRLAELCDGALAEQLSEVFDDLAAPDELLEIPRLDVYLGDLGRETPDPAAMAEATRRALRDLRRGPGAHRAGGRASKAATVGNDTQAPPEHRRHSLARHRRELYVHYLLHGDFGAADPELRPAQLAALLAAEGVALEDLLRALDAAPRRRRRAALQRLLATAPQALRSALLRQNSGNRPAGGRPRRGTGEGTAPGTLADQLLRTIWPTGARSESEESDEGVAADVEEGAPDSDARSLVQAPNAGMVLLAAFLPQLFARAGLVEAQRFRDAGAAITAAQLLHYLASGEVHAGEPQLVIPRLLCGLGPELPLLDESAPAPAQLALVDALIDDAIGHWRKLGNTSREGLRETFLSRPGVLKFTNGNTRIVVEGRGVDVLLGSMPWALSPVRLPWLARPIPVDWQ